MDVEVVPPHAVHDQHGDDRRRRSSVRKHVEHAARHRRGRRDPDQREKGRRDVLLPRRVSTLARLDARAEEQQGNALVVVPRAAVHEAVQAHWLPQQDLARLERVEHLSAAPGEVAPGEGLEERLALVGGACRLHRRLFGGRLDRAGGGEKRDQDSNGAAPRAHRGLSGTCPRLKTMTVLRNSITVVPSWLYPVVRTLTMPTLGRDFDSRFSSTSLRE